VSKLSKKCLTKKNGNYFIKEHADPKRVREMLEDIGELRIEEDLNPYSEAILTDIELKALDFINSKESEA
jgi:hypothetical protein